MSGNGSKKSTQSKFFTDLDGWLAERTTEADGDCILWKGAVTDNAIPSARIQYKTYSVRNLLFDTKAPGKRKSNIVYLCCGNQRCLNFKHMKLKTVSQTRREALETRKAQPGSLQKMRMTAPRSKINEETVTKIRLRLSEPGVTQIQVAKEFDLSPVHVSRIYRWVCWGATSNASSVFSWRPA